MGSARIKPKTLIVTNSDAAVPKRLTADPTPVFVAHVYGKKAARTNNTGIVYLGPDATNDTQALTIAAGAYLKLDLVDLSDFYLDVVTVGDGVVIVYW